MDHNHQYRSTTALLTGVSNIFSDKTGTLTCNEMRLVKFVLNDKIYDIREKYDGDIDGNGGGNGNESGNKSPLHPSDKKGFTDQRALPLPIEEMFGDDKPAFLQFCRCLTTCHTVVRESDGTYRAESPDELALVEAMGNYDCQLLGRGS